MALVIRGRFSGSAHSPTPSPVCGVHSFITMPFGTYRKAIRVGVAVPAAARTKGGIMASRSGSASTVPAPRSTERREILLFKCMLSFLFLPHQERLAFHNRRYQHGKFVPAGHYLLIDLIHRRAV